MVNGFIKNSVPYRKRSPSDVFLDNGLALLNSYLENRGLDVIVEDWANFDFYDKVTDLEIAKKTSNLLLKNSSSSEEYLNLQKAQDLKLRGNFSNKNISLANFLNKNHIGVFGEKTFFGDAWINSKKLYKTIKEISPETIIIAGGPQVSVWRDIIFSDSNADFFILGEGEYSLAKIIEIQKESKNKSVAINEIIKQAKSGKIENLMYYNNGKIQISGISNVNANKKMIPSYNYLDLSNNGAGYKSKSLIHVLIDSLGCPWNKCKMCDHKHIYESYYQRDSDLVVKEVESFLKQGIGFFRYAGSGATLNHQLNIAKAINKRKLNLKYSFFMRATPNAKEVYSNLVESFKEIIESGLICVGMGGESGNDIVNEIFNKGVTTDDIKYTREALFEASHSLGENLDFVIYMMYPTPTGNTSMNKVYNDNLNFIKTLSPTSTVISPLAAFYGAEVFADKSKYGIKVNEIEYNQIMPEFEYTTYLPKQFWNSFNYSIEGFGFDQILAEVMNLSSDCHSAGILTDLTDEQIVYARGSGFKSQESLIDFYKKTVNEMVSCSQKTLKIINESFNKESRKIAESNYLY